MNITPQELVIRVAMATIGAQEVGPNAGAYVERALKLTGLPIGNPWCAAWIAVVGKAALPETWPVPLTASCYALGEWAKKKNCLLTTPTPGAIFLVWRASLNRFAHTGIVVDGADTISGNTTVPGQAGDPREGWAVVRKVWSYRPEDRFIAWWKI